MKVALLLTLTLVGAVTSNKLRVCYYSNWSQYRNGDGKFFPTDIPADLCTHLMYSFAKLDSNHELVMFEWNDDKLYTQFNDLKKVNPALKTLLAVGGWNFGSRLFSEMVHDDTKRRNFAAKAATFLRTWGFDGLDLDWEYPANREGSKPTDKEKFIALIDDLLTEFRAEAASSGLPRMLVTAAVAAGKSTIDPAYDIRAMGEKLDFINLMAYDLHGAWESKTGHNSPLYSRTGEDYEQARLNVDWAAKYWVQNGTPKEKLIIGLATYGRGFTLTDANNHGFGAAASGSSPAGTYTREAGFQAYYEICKLKDNGAKRYWHSEHKVPYLVSGSTWIGYEDEESFGIKLQYIRDEDYGGAMVWNIDLDDFRKVCDDSSQPYPLMRLMESVLGGYDPPTTKTPPSTQAPPATDGPATTKKPATDPPSGEVSCEGRTDGFYKHPTDCSKYFQCWGGTLTLGECPNNLMWNQQQKACDWPANVDCSNTETTATTVRPETTKAQTTKAQTTEAQTTKAQTTEKATTKAPNTDSFCDDKDDGLYTYPYDCSKYYSCGSKNTYVMTCYAGTYWSPAAGNCDWANAVDCGSRPEPGK